MNRGSLTRLTRRGLFRTAAGTLAAPAVLSAFERPASASATAAEAPPVLWSEEFRGDAEVYRLGANNVYVGGASGRVEVRHLKSGSLLETFQLEGAVADIALNEETFVFATESNRLHVFDRRTLSEEWKIATNGGVNALFIDGDSLVICADDGVVSRDVATGEQRWTFGTGFGPAAIRDGTLYGRPSEAHSGFGLSDDREYLYALDVETGETVWTTEATIDRNDGFRQDLVCSNGNVIFNTGTGYNSRVVDGIMAVDAADGSPVWERELDADGGNLTANARAVTFRDDRLTVLSTETGETLFEADLDVNWGGVEMTDDLLFVSATDDSGEFVGAFRPESGIIEWETRTETREMSLEAGREVLTHTDWGGPESDDPVAFTARGPLSGTSGGLEGTRLGAELGSADGTTTKDDGASANFNLTGTSGNVGVGDATVIRLSAVNLLTSRDMTVQLLLELPTGVTVSAVENAAEGSNQFTAVFDVAAGGEDNIGVELSVNDPGEHVVRGEAVYYFGEEKGEAYSTPMATTVTASAGTTADAGQSGSGERGDDANADAPGFGVATALGGAVGGVWALARRRREG